MRIKKNDTVKIISGADRGKTGRVLRVIPGKNKVIVERAGIVKKHMRQNPQEQQQGGIVEKERPVNASNVALLCQRCGRGTRTGYKSASGEGRLRYCKKCGEAA